MCHYGTKVETVKLVLWIFWGKIADDESVFNVLKFIKI